MIRDQGSGIRDQGITNLHAIVFDFDGVIADSERLHLRSYQEILAPEGITMSNEDYFNRYLGYDDVGVFKAIGRDQGVAMDDHRVSELIARKGQKYESLASAGEMLFPGAADFIRAAAAKIPIAIASGALTHEIEEVLDRAGLRSLFPVIVGADQTERSKPHPEPYQTAFARLRAHSGRDLIAWRSVAIEDSRWGLESARGANLRCVAVTNTYTAAELRADAELVVPGLHSLTLEALDALCADSTLVMKPLAEQIADAADRPGPDLAAPAFLVARIEYPRLDPSPYLDRLDRMGDAAFHFVAKDPGHDAPLGARIDAINRYLFGELGFTGNREQFDDPRNSCLNEVMDRKKGIPITMALVYIEVARRAGVRTEGVNFPGHFLVRCLQDLHTDDPSEGLIVDPFHGGAILNEDECRKLLQPHMSDAAYEPSLLARATRRQILVRMLLNLKKLYVKMHSFPQARATTDALLALQPSSLADLRDRGLLAYHMNDFSHALRDLEEYLKVARLSDQDDDQKKETEQVWEHVKTLRRRVAQLN